MYKRAKTIEDDEYERKISNELLGETFNNENYEYVQELCLKYIENEYYDIVCLSITCLGHLARIHKYIDKDKILPILNEKMKDEELAGVVEGALEDIEQFAK